MRLSPADKDKLLLAVAGMIARDRLARGVKLNHPEAVALLTCWVIEGARDGRSVAELMTDGRAVLQGTDVMEGVAEMIPDVQVEATFPDGRKLVTLHDPIAPTPPVGGAEPTIPGELRTAEGTIELNAGRETLDVVMINRGDRPIQVGSHFHVADVNDAVGFEEGGPTAELGRELSREAVSGYRLDIAAGTSVRLEPGASKAVTLVALGGRGKVFGLRVKP